MKRVAVAALLCFFLLPSSLSAHVVIDSCIGGVSLWDSSTQVLRQWGNPTRKVKRPPDVWWHYRKGSVLLTPWGRSSHDWIVLAVTTTDPKQRTRAGIGVGSWLSEVRAAYGPWCFGRQGSCDIGSGQGRDTYLRFKRGRVVEVSVSLDSSYDDGARRAPDPRCRSAG
jgi:hypothetical protein